MKVIHDNELGGIAMVPLICGWHISQTCQIRDCKEKTTTIVCFNSSESPTGEPLNIGICEKHYQESREQDKFYYTVDIPQRIIY